MSETIFLHNQRIEVRSRGGPDFGHNDLAAIEAIVRLERDLGVSPSFPMLHMSSDYAETGERFGWPTPPTLVRGATNTAGLDGAELVDALERADADEDGEGDGEGDDLDERLDELVESDPESDPESEGEEADGGGQESAAAAGGSSSSSSAGGGGAGGAASGASAGGGGGAGGAASGASAAKRRRKGKARLGTTTTSAAALVAGIGGGGFTAPAGMAPEEAAVGFPSAAPMRARGVDGRPLLLLNAIGARRQSKKAARKTKAFFNATWPHFIRGTSIDFEAYARYWNKENKTTSVNAALLRQYAEGRKRIANQIRTCALFAEAISELNRDLRAPVAGADASRFPVIEGGDTRVPLAPRPTSVPEALAASAATAAGQEAGGGAAAPAPAAPAAPLFANVFSVVFTITTGKPLGLRFQMAEGRVVVVAFAPGVDKPVHGHVVQQSGSVQYLDVVLGVGDAPVPDSADVVSVLAQIRAAMGTSSSVVITFGRPAAAQLAAPPPAILAAHAASAAGASSADAADAAASAAAAAPRPGASVAAAATAVMTAPAILGCKPAGAADIPAAAATKKRKRSSCVCHTCGHYRTGEGNWAKRHKSDSYSKVCPIPPNERLEKPATAPPASASFPLVAKGSGVKIPGWRKKLGDV